MENQSSHEWNLNNKILTPTELCQFLNLKTSMMRSLVFSKRIPFIKIGRLIRFDRDEILKWIEKNKEGK